MGKGYAFEIANATMRYAETELKLQTILAITDPENQRSIRLLEKIGLLFVKTTVNPVDQKALMLFSTN